MDSSGTSGGFHLHPISSRRRRIRRDRRLRRSRSLPSSNHMAHLHQLPEPRPYLLPPLEIQLPETWHLWKPAVVYCPPVASSPRWRPYPNYGLKETGLRLCDTRSTDDKFSFPLKGYDIWEIESMPDEVLAKIITDWNRTPGPGVCQAEADILWIIEKERSKKTHVPVVHKVLRDDTTRHLVIIMDYIRGSNLVDIWRSISDERRDTIIANIIQPIRNMQTKTARYPGPVGINRMRALVHKDFPVPLRMNGFDYDQYMNVLFNAASSNGQDATQTSNVVKTCSSRFVLANMKLDPSSFIVDKVGKIYIVGWGNGGFYPPESEMAMVEHLMPSRYKSLSWQLIMQIKHDWPQRQHLRKIAAMIDDDPLETKGISFSPLGYQTEEKI